MQDNSRRSFLQNAISCDPKSANTPFDPVLRVGFDVDLLALAKAEPFDVGFVHKENRARSVDAAQAITVAVNGCVERTVRRVSTCDFETSVSGSVESIFGGVKFAVLLGVLHTRFDALMPRWEAPAAGIAC